MCKRTLDGTRRHRWNSPDHCVTNNQDVDAYGEDKQLWAFRQVIEDEVSLSAEGEVIGETVLVTKIDYDGNPQRGLRATCRKPGGKTYEVALVDVEFPMESKAAPYVAAYRKWLGVP